jgi:hypothetical protein
MRSRNGCVEWASDGAAILAAVILFYFLTAPWFVIKSINSHTPLPTIYNPVIYLLESDYRGPLVWYMKSVWRTEFLSHGVGSENIPKYASWAWALAGAAWFGLIFFPCARRLRRLRMR